MLWGNPQGQALGPPKIIFKMFKWSGLLGNCFWRERVEVALDGAEE